MSVQFSRSMRTIHVDSYRAAQIGILLAGVILAALVVWFFNARITLYEFSTTVNVTEDKRLVAHFRPEAAARLKPGQRAILRVNYGTDQQMVSAPAVIFGVQPGSEEVEIIVTTTDLPENLFGEGFKGQVEAEVDYITPAQLVQRALGSYLNRAQLPASSGEAQGQP